MQHTRTGAHQSRAWPPPAYELKLARTIEEIFGTGVHDLPGLVAALNGSGVTGPDGAAWSEESFTQEMKKLGV